jgi:hypothetical protein
MWTGYGLRQVGTGSTRGIEATLMFISLVIWGEKNFRQQMTKTAMDGRKKTQNFVKRIWNNEKNAR